jgi:hypothetical protein
MTRFFASLSFLAALAVTAVLFVALLAIMAPLAGLAWVLASAVTVSRRCWPWVAVAALCSPLAHAEPPANADPALAPWFHSLRDPVSGMGCCDQADCRPVVTRETGGRIEAFIDAATFRDGPDRWVPVPTETVLRGKENPTGGPVLCWAFGRVLCFVDGWRG